MKRTAAISCILLLLAACDVQLAFRGTVSSSTGKPLRACSISLKSRETNVRAEFNPPAFDQFYAVSPFAIRHNITIQCAGHVPRDIDASKNNGNLGNIVLVPESGG